MTGDDIRTLVQIVTGAVAIGALLLGLLNRRDMRREPARRRQQEVRLEVRNVLSPLRQSVREALGNVKNARPIGETPEAVNEASDRLEVLRDQREGHDAQGRNMLLEGRAGMVAGAWHDVIYAEEREITAISDQVQTERVLGNGPAREKAVAEVREAVSYLSVKRERYKEHATNLIAELDKELALLSKADQGKG